MTYIILVLFIALFPLGFFLALYFAFKRKYFKVVLSLLLPFIVWLCFPEGYFYPYPMIDTYHSKEFSENNFAKIEIGMTRDDVKSFIGDRVSSHVDIGGYENGTEECERQTEDGKLKYWDFAWLNAYVCYDEQGKVLSTYSFWQQD